MPLTKHIQSACSGGIVTNAIWCKALITASLTTINSCKNKLFSAGENIPSVLPYPCDTWRRITWSITMKSYITSFSYWTWTLLCWHLGLDCKNNNLFLLTEREGLLGNTGVKLEVAAVQTDHSKVLIKMTKDQYSSVQFEQGRLVCSLFIALTC